MSAKTRIFDLVFDAFTIAAATPFETETSFESCSLILISFDHY